MIALLRLRDYEDDSFFGRTWCGEFDGGRSSDAYFRGHVGTVGHAEQFAHFLGLDVRSEYLGTGMPKRSLRFAALWLGRQILGVESVNAVVFRGDNGHVRRGAASDFGLRNDQRLRVDVPVHDPKSQLAELILVYVGWCQLGFPQIGAGAGVVVALG